MSADAERFCERQNRQPILIGFVSDICRLMLRGFVKDKTTIQIGFVSDMSADAERFVSFQKSADPNRFRE